MDTSNSRDSMEGHSRKAIGNDRVDSRYITDANSSRDACELYSIREPSNNSDTTNGMAYQQGGQSQIGGQQQ